MTVSNNKITEDYLIKKLSDKKYKLKENEYDKLKNILWNLGFGEGPKMSDLMFFTLLDKKLDLTNPIHRGIMIGFLMQSKYNSLDPIIPFHKKKISKKISDEITNIGTNRARYIIKTLPKIK